MKVPRCTLEDAGLELEFIIIIIIIIIGGLSLLQSIPPTAANKQTQAQL